jgi:hypothetical protein
MVCATRPDRNPARFLHVCERDASFPRDSDGCPTASGVEWIINPLDVTAIKLTPDRGGAVDAVIHVRGLPEPIRCCEDGDGIMAALGVPGPPLSRLLDQIDRRAEQQQQSGGEAP